MSESRKLKPSPIPLRQTIAGSFFHVRVRVGGCACRVCACRACHVCREVGEFGRLVTGGLAAVGVFDSLGVGGATYQRSLSLACVGSSLSVCIVSCMRAQLGVYTTWGQTESGARSGPGPGSGSGLAYPKPNPKSKPNPNPNPNRA